MAHESRLTRELRALLHAHRVATLGTISDEGFPFVSMVPFALVAAYGCVVIHVSGLAAHTRYLTERPKVSLMVMQPEVAGEPVHALPRITMEGVARVLAPDAMELEACRGAYLRRFPEAEHMTQLGDFRFVAVQIKSGRHVAGFAAARSIDEAELRLALESGQ
jgi:heme iron utilization protein